MFDVEETTTDFPFSKVIVILPYWLVHFVGVGVVVAVTVNVDVFVVAVIVVVAWLIL